MSAQPPSVAVLISTFNGERFLKDQLESLLAQDCVVVEVFARDDGSSDRTVELLREYAQRWPALALSADGARLGPEMSFLELLKSAPGGFDFYAFCDQDDVWLPQKLACATRRLASAANGAPALYCSRVQSVDIDLQPIAESPLQRDTSFERLLFSNVAFGNTLVMNAVARELVCSCAPVEGVAHHDWWCALVVSAFGSVMYDDSSYILYRQHGRNNLGGAGNGFRELVRFLRVLWRNPRRFYPIHAQAVEFQRCFEKQLSQPRRALVACLVNSRRSFLNRLKLAASPKVKSTSTLGSVVCRALILANIY